MMPLLVWQIPSRFGTFFFAMTMDTNQGDEVYFTDKDEQNL